MIKSRKKSKFIYYKEQAWKFASLYIRQINADQRGFVKCITCPTIQHWKNMDAGHYKKRANMATFLYEKNLGVQCHHCNRNLDGNTPEFEKYIINTYGRDELDYIIDLSNSIQKYTWFELAEIATEYKNKLIANNLKLS